MPKMDFRRKPHLLLIHVRTEDAAWGSAVSESPQACPPDRTQLARRRRLRCPLEPVYDWWWAALLAEDPAGKNLESWVVTFAIVDAEDWYDHLAVATANFPKPRIEVVNHVFGGTSPWRSYFEFKAIAARSRFYLPAPESYVDDDFFDWGCF